MGWPGGQPASLAEHAVWPAGWAHSSKPTSQCGWLAAVQLAGQLAGWLSSWLAHWLACCWPAARWRELRTFTLRPFARGTPLGAPEPMAPRGPRPQEARGPLGAQGPRPQGKCESSLHRARENGQTDFFFREGPNLTFSRKCKIEARKKAKSSQEKGQIHTRKWSNRNREMVKYTPL